MNGDSGRSYRTAKYPVKLVDPGPEYLDGYVRMLKHGSMRRLRVLPQVEPVRNMDEAVLPDLNCKMFPFFPGELPFVFASACHS